MQGQPPTEPARSVELFRSKLLRLRTEYEARNAGEFELVYPPAHPGLQEVYDQLLLLSKRCLLEERFVADNPMNSLCGVSTYGKAMGRQCPPGAGWASLGVGEGRGRGEPASANAPHGPLSSAMQVDGEAPSASKGNLARSRMRALLLQAAEAERSVAEASSEVDEDHDSAGQDDNAGDDDNAGGSDSSSVDSATLRNRERRRRLARLLKKAGYRAAGKSKKKRGRQGKGNDAARFGALSDLVVVHTKGKVKVLVA